MNPNIKKISITGLKTVTIEVDKKTFDHATFAIGLSINNKIYKTSIASTAAVVVATASVESLFKSLTVKSVLSVKAYSYSKSTGKVVNAKQGDFTYYPDSKKLEVGELKTTLPIVPNHKLKTPPIAVKPRKSKPKMHFTIGMFFDGTCNNKYNSDSRYYKNIISKDLLFKSIPEVKKLETSKGTISIDSDSSYWNSYSNIALLHDMYKSGNPTKAKDGQAVVIKQYVQGIGTSKDTEDDIWGLGFGEGKRGILGKVLEGSNDLAFQIGKIIGTSYEIGSVTFDVFGFSRGAAAARHFCNEILGKKTAAFDHSMLSSLLEYGYVLESPFFSSDKLLFDPVGYSLPSYQPSPKLSPKVRIRFLGLFDSVISQILVKNHFDRIMEKIPVVRNYVNASEFEDSLNIIKQNVDKLPIEKIFHLTTQDEWRANFALTTVRQGLEIAIPGAHSDIGGGYTANKQDVTIIDYQNVPAFSSIPKRLKTLREFYKQYCEPKEIEIVLRSIRIGGIGAVQKIYQLKATRSVLPRYSVVPLKAMAHIAGIVGVPIQGPPANHPYPFEFTTPRGLEIYLKYVLYKCEKKFREKYKLSGPIKADKVESIDNATIDLIKKKFIHLSASYNSALVFDLEGENLDDFKILDKIFYANMPRFKNANNNSYEREIYNHKQ
ncbi:MAG TPA: DUF2235 domain-containing protein [Flavobacterium sp.]|jgi:hypothetical protein